MTSKTIFFKNSLYNIITNFVFSIIFFIPYLLNKYYLNIHELAALSLAQNYLEFFIYLFYFLRIWIKFYIFSSLEFMTVLKNKKYFSLYESTIRLILFIIENLLFIIINHFFISLPNIKNHKKIIWLVILFSIYEKNV